jgi:D-3-phosphoglycerate dehydrogenase
MVGQISRVLGQNDINIQHMVNESRNELAYTLMDVDKSVDDDIIQQIKQIDGVLASRVVG